MVIKHFTSLISLILHEKLLCCLFVCFIYLLSPMVSLATAYSPRRLRAANDYELWREKEHLLSGKHVRCAVREEYYRKECAAYYSV